MLKDNKQTDTEHHAPLCPSLTSRKHRNRSIPAIFFFPLFSFLRSTFFSLGMEIVNMSTGPRDPLPESRDGHVVIITGPSPTTYRIIFSSIPVATELLLFPAKI